MGYYELKFSSHDHSDTKQAQPWSCIGRYRGHDFATTTILAVMLVWVNEKAIFCSDFSRVVFDELKFSSHDHSDTKQPQPWSCIGRYRGHGLKRPQPRFWPLCWSG